jgi:hypothetical protein
MGMLERRRARGQSSFDAVTDFDAPLHAEWKKQQRNAQQLHCC